jgi:hypothetical protein
MNKLEEFAEKDSGWALHEVIGLKVNINRYDPLKIGFFFFFFFFYLKFCRASTAVVISPMLFYIIGFIVSGIFHNLVCIG